MTTTSNNPLLNNLLDTEKTAESFPLAVSNFIVQFQTKAFALGRDWVALANEKIFGSPSTFFEPKKPDPEKVSLAFKVDFPSLTLLAGSTIFSGIGVYCLNDKKKRREGWCFLALGLTGISVALYRSIEVVEK